MNGPLSFKAQALDNTSPDHYQIGDEVLSVQDQARRLQVTNMVSEVARKGTHDLKADGAELIFRDRRFLVQVYSEQLDHAGRRAPILCCGEFSHGDDPEDIIKAIRGFAANIDRTVDRRHINAVRGGLAKLNKVSHGDDSDADTQDLRRRLTRLKKKSRALPLAVSISIGIALLLAGLYTLRPASTTMRAKMQSVPVPPPRMSTPERLR